jgi:hypothetical protein
MKRYSYTRAWRSPCWLAKIDPNGVYNIIADALTGKDEVLQRFAVIAMVDGNFSSKLMTLFPKTSAQTKLQILSVVDNQPNRKLSPY